VLARGAKCCAGEAADDSHAACNALRNLWPDSCIRDGEPTSRRLDAVAKHVRRIPDGGGGGGTEFSELSELRSQSIRNVFQVGQLAARKNIMALIRCTIVEAPVMPSRFETGSDQPFPAPAGYLSEHEPTGMESGYHELLPWADPYIVSLVRGLQAASGATLAHAWPSGSAAWAGASRLEPGSGDRWSNRFGSWGK
jgi:hypothetical protein